MRRIVQKFSIVYVSLGDKTEVFRSTEDIPEEVRRRIAQTARKSQVETLVIANEKGREMLNSRGVTEQPERPPVIPPLSPRLRWAILSLLTGGVGLLMMWLIHFR